MAGGFTGLLAAAMLFAGANAYEKFYQPSSDTDDAPPPYAAEPVVRGGTGDPGQDLAQMYADGWTMIGYTQFNGGSASEKNARKQARAVGAEIVVMSSELISTETRWETINTPATARADTRGSVGGYGGVPYDSSTKVDVQGKTAVPVEVKHYAHYATYYRRLPRTGLGMLLDALKPERAAELGTNKGMVIISVRRSSPAFLADVFVGDVVTSINGKPIYDGASLTAAKASPGKVQLALLRDGKPITISFDLPEGEW
jgi:hypothetical protein